MTASERQLQMLDQNFQSIINTELLRLKREEEDLRYAFLLKKKEYLLNKIDNDVNKLSSSSTTNSNSNNLDINNTYSSIKNNNQLDDYNNHSHRFSKVNNSTNINDNNNYYNSPEVLSFQCDVCSGVITSRARTTGKRIGTTSSIGNNLLNSSKKYSTYTVKNTNGDSGRLNRSLTTPTIQDLNNQQTLSYDYKKYVKPINRVKFEDTQRQKLNLTSSSQITATPVRSQSATSNRYYLDQRKIEDVAPMLKSSHPLFQFKRSKSFDKDLSVYGRPKEPWHYTNSRASIYPFRDHVLKTSK